MENNMICLKKIPSSNIELVYAPMKEPAAEEDPAHWEAGDGERHGGEVLGVLLDRFHGRETW